MAVIWAFLLTSSVITATFAIEAVNLRTWLPSSRYGLAALYDGENGILLFGGRNNFGVRMDEVLKFNLSSEEIQVVGRFPLGIALGAAQYSRNNVEGLYFGGYTELTNYSSVIWSTRSSNNMPYPVANLPEKVRSSCSAFDGNDSVYIVGGYGGSFISSNVLKYSISSQTVEIVATLPNSTFDCVATWFNNSVYIFGGYKDALYRKIVKFTPTLEENNLEILPVEIPADFRPGNAVTIGRFIYLVDGILGNRDCEYDVTFPCPMAIVKFDPIAGNQDNLIVMTVVNMPISLYSAATYVEKYSRIYLFGGLHMDGRTSYKIHYINSCTCL